MKLFVPNCTTLIAFAAADAARGQAADPVLEIVDFRLVDGADETAFLEAARATETALRAQGAMVRRYLVCNDQGGWTDVIEWTSSEAALAAAKSVMAHPDSAPFGSMIDGDTVEMRHPAIVWRMD